MKQLYVYSSPDHDGKMGWMDRWMDGCVGKKSQKSRVPQPSRSPRYFGCEPGGWGETNWHAASNPCRTCISGRSPKLPPRIRRRLTVFSRWIPTYYIHHVLQAVIYGLALLVLTSDYEEQCVCVHSVYTYFYYRQGNLPVTATCCTTE